MTEIPADGGKLYAVTVLDPGGCSASAAVFDGASAGVERRCHQFLRVLHPQHPQHLDQRKQLLVRRDIGLRHV